MPRIDPLQLLKCLSVLLSPEGGILSRDEVPRLVNLMTKFSKKLVSKCVYVLILKNTETSLVDMFMAEGGWTLIQTWLQDAVKSGNWDLVKEILGLLLITPVDVERLKMNCLPKLIKSLSRKEDLGDVSMLSNQIVQNWLSIVKGSAHGVAGSAPIQARRENREVESKSPSEDSKDSEESNSVVATPSVSSDEPTPKEIQENVSVESDQSIKTSSFYKVSVKDGKQVIRKLSSEGDKASSVSNEESSKKEDNKDDKIVEKDLKSNEKEKEKSLKSSSTSKSKSSSSSRDKDKDKDKKRSTSRSSSSKSKSSNGNSSSSSSSSSSKDKDRDRKDKDKERDRKDKDKERSKRSSSSRSSSKSSSSSSKDKKDAKDKSKSSDTKESEQPKETKEKQAEKDKDTLEKLKPQTLDKLGRIPKKSSGSIDEKQKENKAENKPKENPDKKKPSFSILNRKATGEERSKTVKVFNSKMRSTGLEEEAKPPPPRGAKKPTTPSVQLPTIPTKRPSPPRELSTIMPPEKKLKIDKIDIPDRPGAIKLIPPKPKPAVLQESDMFMDALAAAAPKKEAKKRKRRLSVTKDVPTSPSASPSRGDAQAPTSPTPSSPTTALGLKNIAPINFYQDTMSEDPENTEDIKEEKTTDETNEEVTNSPEDTDTPASPPVSTTDVEVPMESEDSPSAPKQMKLEGGLKGVLLYAKKKGPKRSIRWKSEEDLVEIKYFELDETERVNVTKTFMDMAKMEVSGEREALIMSRKLPNEDTMEPQTMWRVMYLCEQPDPLVAPGSKSLEKDIQFAREKTVLPALYFDKRRIPDSPEEPIPENHQMSDPVIIPLEDPECQEIDLRNTPWPEPKGPAPQMEPPPMQPIFQNMPFNPNFNNMGNIPPGAPFAGVPPRFPGPPGPLGPMGPMQGNFGPPNMMHNNMMVPQMNQPDMMNPGPMNPGVFGPGPEGFMAPGNEPNYPMQQFNGPQGPNMNMTMYGPNNFNHRGGGGGGRGGSYRRGGGNNGGWVQMNGPRNWKRGGGGGRGGRMCKNVQNHGYCRNIDTCPFVH